MSMKKFAIVTGGNSGLGLHLAKWLFKNGFGRTEETTSYDTTIVLACRNRERVEQAVNEITHQLPRLSIEQNENSNSSQHPTVQFMQLDLASLQSVREFVKNFNKICPEGSLYLLVNNAGVMNHPLQLAEDGVEIHFASNYLGHFYLTKLLQKHFAPNARILNVTSGFYEKCSGIPAIEEFTPSTVDNLQQKGYTPSTLYSLSKLANCLHTVSLNETLQNSEDEKQKGIKVVAIRPGFVRGTNLGRHTNAILRFLATPLIWLVAKGLDEGIATMVHCVQCSDEELQSGQLYYNSQVIPFKAETVTLAAAQKLTEESEILIEKILNK